VVVPEDRVEDHVTTVESPDTCRGTVQRSVPADRLVRAVEAVEAGGRATSAARRGICLVSVLRRGTVHRVARMIVNVTTVGREVIYHETALTPQTEGPEVVVVEEMNASHVERPTISKEIVRRRQPAALTEERQTCAVTTATKWATCLATVQ